ncbi:MAG TPA: hypothetical protein VIJ68_02950 [Candidatus Saccharimonadales bacterium]
MALATRPKPTVSHRKRQAQHHRQDKSYLGTYWPYLPLFAIVGGGAIVSKAWSAGVLPGVNSTPDGSSLAAAGQVTRIQAMAGARASTSLAAVIIISGLAFAVFVFRHSRRLSRALTRGETFAYEHVWLDVVTVLIFTAGFVLTRAAA